MGIRPYLLASVPRSCGTEFDIGRLRRGRIEWRVGFVTKAESEALLVLAPGVLIRAGVNCPHCRHGMVSQAEWSVRDSVMEWSYVCQRCGTVLDVNMKVVSPLGVWQRPGRPAAGSPPTGGRQRRIVPCSFG